MWQDGKVQWGAYSWSANGGENQKEKFSFPVSYTSSCFAVVVQDKEKSDGGTWKNSISAFITSKSQFEISIAYGEAGKIFMISCGK